MHKYAIRVINFQVMTKMAYMVENNFVKVWSC